MSQPLEPGQGAPGLWTLIPPSSWAGATARPYHDRAGNLVIPAGYSATWIPATPGTIAAVSSVGGGALVDFAPEGAKILGETADGKVIVLDEIPDASDPILDLGTLLVEVAQVPIRSDGLQEALQAGRNLIEQQHEEHARTVEFAARMEAEFNQRQAENQRFRDQQEAFRRQMMDEREQRDNEAMARLYEWQAELEARNMAELQDRWAREDAAAIATYNQDVARAQAMATQAVEAIAEGIRKAEQPGDDHAAHRAAGRALQEQVAAIARTDGREAAEAYAAKELEKFKRDHPEATSTGAGGGGGAAGNPGSPGKNGGAGLGGGSSLAGTGGESSAKQSNGFPWWLLLIGVALTERKR